MLFSTEKLVEV